MSEEKQKEKRPSKKVVIREIVELNDRFDFNSLERTNLENLIVIKELCLKERVNSFIMGVGTIFNDPIGCQRMVNRLL